MKAKLKESQGLNSLLRIIEAIKMMWVRDLPQAYFKKLSASMPRRIKQNPGFTEVPPCGLNLGPS
jgi:hypothetical protein